MSDSYAMRLAALPQEKREEILGQFDTFETALLAYAWEGFLGRPEQIFPREGYRYFLNLAGRGHGKTRGGGQWVIGKAARGRAPRGAIIGPDEAEIRKYMIEGPSGILASSPPWFMPTFAKSRGLMTLKWPNGTIAECHSAELPQYRGPNLDWVWFDEPAKCRWLELLWPNVKYCMRGSGLGREPPQALLTGTPLPLDFFRELKKNKRTYFVGGSSLDNAINLDAEYVQELVDLGDTRQARQERGGELLEDEKGTLFPKTTIDEHRIMHPSLVPSRFLRGLVIIDPADSTTQRSDPTGLVAMASDTRGHLYIFEGRSDRFPGPEWAELAFNWRDKHATPCDRFEIIGEKNKGGELVKTTLRLYEENRWYKMGGKGTFQPSEIGLWWSSESKADRAKPVSDLYAAGRVHHVGVLAELEAEMTGWVPGVTRKSPNGLDALVIGAHILILGEKAPDEAEALRGVGGARVAREAGPAPSPDAAAALGKLSALFGDGRGGFGSVL